MKEIDLNTPISSRTFMIYGPTRSGKTTFAGTFPRPLFLSEATEGGYESLSEDNWDDNTTPRFEANVPPIVWTIEKQSDMVECLEKAIPLVKSGRVKTLVIDSISFYADLYLTMLIQAQDKKDMRRAYGDLGIHLRNLRVKPHSLGVNVVWLGLDQAPICEDNKPTIPGKPLIPGAQADKFMAGVGFIFHSRVDMVNNKAPVYQLRTKRFNGYEAGNRLGLKSSLLPDPFVGNYSDLMATLGYDVEKMKKELPPIDGNGISGNPRVVVPVKKPIIGVRPVG
jgi:hypothetical protein